MTDPIRPGATRRTIELERTYGPMPGTCGTCGRPRTGSSRGGDRAVKGWESELGKLAAVIARRHA